MPRRVALCFGAAGAGLLAGGRDATKIHELLVDPSLGACDPDRSLLRADSASRSEVLDLVVETISGWDPADQLLIYYSGHGLYRNSTYCLGIGGDRSSQLLPFDSLLSHLRAGGVRRSLIILDACHSGGALTRGAKQKNDELWPCRPQELPLGIGLLSSSRHDEWSWEKYDRNESVFTHLLCEAIESGLGGTPTSDGYISAAQAVEYVRRRLTNDETLRPYHQIPVYEAQEAEGRIWISRNLSRATRQAATDEAPPNVAESLAAEVDHFYRTTHGYRLPCPDASLDDLDWSLVEAFATSAGYDLGTSTSSNDVAKVVGLFSPKPGGERQLQRAAVLCFADRPDRFIPEATSMFLLGSKTEPTVTRIYGPLAKQAQELLDLARAATGASVTFSDDGRPIRQPATPDDVLREAISNAIVHRNYEKAGSVVVHVDENTVTITSPGLLAIDRSFEDLMSNPASRPTDSAIAIYLVHLLAFEQAGRGFHIFRQFRQEYGDRAILGREDLASEQFTVTIRRPSRSPNPAQLGGGRQAGAVDIPSDGGSTPTDGSSPSEGDAQLRLRTQPEQAPTFPLSGAAPYKQLIADESRSTDYAHLVDDARSLYCPICSDITADRVIADQVRVFGADGSRLPTAYLPVTDTSILRRLVDEFLEGRRSPEVVLRHDYCRNAVSTRDELASIAIVGGPSSGKTHLLLALLRQMDTGPSRVIASMRSIGEDNRTLAEAREVYELRRATLRTTIPTRAAIEPLLALAELPDPDDRRRRHRRRTYFYDIPGELTERDEALSSLQFLPDIQHFILAIEPADIPLLADRLGLAPTSSSIFGMLGAIADTSRAGSEHKGDGIPPSDATISVVITKADLLPALDDESWAATLSEQLTQLGNGAKWSSHEAWCHSLRQHSKIVRDFLSSDLCGEWGAVLVSVIERSFSLPSYHLAAPLGMAPILGWPDGHTSGFEYNEYTMAGTVEPFARGLWASIGRDPIVETGSDQ